MQIRLAARTTGATASNAVYSRFNADSGSNYNAHFLLGNGSSVSSGTTGTTTYGLSGIVSASGAGANEFGAGVLDLLDFSSTSKNATLRTLAGTTSNNRIDLHSALWIDTSAITSWELLPELGNFVAGTRFSLYGIKAGA